MDVSAVIAVHPDDDLDEFKAAVESLLDQTLPPTELLILYDEHIRTKQRWLIDDWKADHPDMVRPIEVPASDGRGVARAKGIETASNELVAIMDSDDVSMETRLEYQARFLDCTDTIDAVGGYIEEYDPNLETKKGVRKVPTDPMRIRRLAQVRCPMNHPTVMVRRNAVIDAGNYCDLDYGEDWDLWLRMLKNGSQLCNLPIVFVKARTGDDWQKSRGPAIAIDEIRLQKQLVQNGIVNPAVAAFNLSVRLPVRLAPNNLREVIYEKFLRSQSAST